MRLKMVTLLLKSWQKGSYFLEQFLWVFSLMFWGMGHPVHLNILWSIVPSKTHCKIEKRMKKKYIQTSVKTAFEFAPKNTPFCHDFKSRVTIFKRIFLRLQELKWQSFSAHQKENYMQITKLTLLLFLVSFLWELWPFKHGPAFFGTPCMYKYSLCTFKTVRWWCMPHYVWTLMTI